MWRGQIKYGALWLFLTCVVLIVFIQFISGKNINHLINGNERLLNEVSVQNKLRQLESNVLTVESDIRGLIITNDSLSLGSVPSKIHSIQNQLTLLKHQLGDSLAQKELALLDELVRKKIQFSYQVIHAYRLRGKKGGEDMINSGRGKMLRDSIAQVVVQLDQTRQKHLREIIRSVEANGNRARFWGLLLAAIACVACVLTFLYIVNKGRQQQKAIRMLNESEKKIKDMAQVKEQFLANMSHEIRTPMNAILGFTNLLKKTNLSSQQVQYVEYIYSSGENLLTLINDILDLSKIEAGMMNIEESPFSLNGLVSSVEVMFRDKARQKGLAFEITIEEGIHDTLCGDPVRLTQILINLLSNAVKFTEKGFVRMEVKAEKQTEQQIELRFSVTDSGLGIPSQKKKAIFERFQQADVETTRRFGGTGLGLSIVKQLVDLQRGQIDVKSEVGKGSTFSVLLPFRRIYDYEFMHPVVSPQQIRDNIRNIRVLIAEDNLMNQQLIRHLMKQWRLDYTLVGNGKEVLQALKRKEYSLVLMDIQMPEMDGYDTTTAIRNELNMDIPIVAMTAHAMVGEKERCLSFGMNDYISKPIKDAELYNILLTHAENRPVEPIPETLIDLMYLKELSLGDAEFENAIIRQFISQIPEELQFLKEAIEQENFTQIKALAHGMKSSVAFLGLSDKIYPYLQRIEEEAIAKQTDNHFNEDFADVAHICHRALHEAKQLLQVTA